MTQPSDPGLIPNTPAVRSFLTLLAGLPGHDPDLPPHLADAWKRQPYNCGYFAEQATMALEALPAAERAEVLPALAIAATRNYRLAVVLALHHLLEQDLEAAHAMVRLACDSSICDLYPENLLISLEAALAAGRGETSAWDGLDEYLATRTCPAPFQHFELASNGSAFLCCPGWLPVPVGNVHETPAEVLWNSEMAQELRRSVLDGSFRYCSRLYCPYINGRDLPARAEPGAGELSLAGSMASGQQVAPSQVLAFPHAVARPRGPEKLVLTYDRSCNLSCPSCRHELEVASPEEWERQDRVFEDLLKGLMSDLRVLRMDGAGEVFVSQPSRRLLKQLTRERFPDLRFDLITNGQLCDRRAFEEFDLQGRVISIQVSVDAASEATYRIVRRGGDWSRLQRNLAFLHEQLEAGEGFRFTLLFVVQAANFREMPEFVRMARSLGAEPGFSIVRHWGHLEQKDFDALNVADPSHPGHPDFLTVLKSPELGGPGIDLGNLAQLRAALL